MNKTMLVKVKRCPFCNSHNLSLQKNSVVSWIECLHCRSCGPIHSLDEDAVASWNGTHKHQNSAALIVNRQSNHHELKEIDL